MMKKCLIWLLVLTVLCGCSGKTAAAETPAAVVEAGETEATEATVAATVPEDGDPENVTCKGSYAAGVTAGVVAKIGEETLTGEQLQVWYWAEVAQYAAENHEVSPDFSRPLDTQVCEMDDSVASWQQYFLREALNAWHSAQALVLQSETVPMPTEEAYKPNLNNYEEYLKDIPATKYLYGYNVYYQVNTLHQEYLEALPERLKAQAVVMGYTDTADMAKQAFGTTEEAVLSYAETLNRGYMYFTDLSYYIEPTQEELLAFYEENKGDYSDGGSCVDIRHILLVPEEGTVAESGKVTAAEEAWAACEAQAEQLLADWRKDRRCSEYTFGELAVKQSRDSGTALDGGRYLGIAKGQLMAALDNWCFDAARQPGDTVILRSEYGVHILYFVKSEASAYAEAVADYYEQQQTAILEEAKAAHPMEVSYGDITLGQAKGNVYAGQILYPDVAHERFPEIPLYLQQDYPDTKYGGYKITTNGCGITSLAMLASYMADDELTPPEMCARYGSYSHSNGTDGMIFNYEPAVMGFYLREKTYDNRVAKAALEEGQIVISIQHPGYWTRGGHYIVCEEINEEGLVQVRDSNIYNYGKIHGHKEDLHKWGNIVAAGSGYWIYEDKITYIPACSRCGTGEAITGQLLKEDYVCHKCDTALLRRGSYLAG